MKASPSKNHQDLRHPVPLWSFTARELRDGNDPGFIHRGERMSGFSDSDVFLEKAEGETLFFRVKSQSGHAPYRVLIRFEGLLSLAEDSGIPLDQAIAYAIEDGDVQVWCGCPSFLYYGFWYQATQLDYEYPVGNGGENRFPEIRNPHLKSTVCKHVQFVLDWILRHKKETGEALLRSLQ